MKICMMTNTYLPHVGGVARSVHTFAETFRKCGHRVLVVAPKYPGDERLQAGVKKRVVRLPAIQQFNGSDFSVHLPLMWQVNPILNNFKPDIVHSHHPYLLGDSALRYAADKNAPVIFTHHTLHEEYTHYVPFDSSALKQFVIELCTQYANLCDAVIAPSESIAQLIRRRGVTAPIEVIPTGIDVTAFTAGQRARFRQTHGLPANAFIVGHLGRLAPEKNLEYLARSVADFLQLSDNARFLVVGDGPMSSTVREIFEREGLAARLVMPGKLSGKNLYDAYAAMDVFAFASLTETQGLVLTEAMAAGLPVIALDASGVREVVRNGTNGLLLGADTDASSFATGLRHIEQDRALHKQLRLGAQRTAREFSENACARKTLNLYERMLSQSRRERSQTEQETFGTLRKRLAVEWGLVTGKSEAVIEAIARDQQSQKAS